MPGSPHLETAWSHVSRELRSRLGDATVDLWLAPLALVARRGNVLVVAAPESVRAWVEQRYLPTLAAAAQAALGDGVEIDLVDEDWEDSARPSIPGAPTELEERPRGAPADRTSLNPKYTFEQFVICDSNRLAHAAALVVAELPGQAYNPLFLHGPPGLGKSHLLHAIGNYVHLHGGGLRTRYATVETFMVEFVDAVRGGDIGAFRERLRSLDVLLVDDVQFLAGKMGTMEELFHTFNALVDAGGQVVLAGDREPSELRELEVRLTERFGSGLVAELSPPDLEARLAMLRKRAVLDAVGEVDEATLVEIAHRVRTSVRALESALIRVVAYASLTGEAPSPALAERVLSRLGTEEAHRPGAPTVEGIQVAVAAHFGVTREVLLAPDRRPNVALARQVAMYLARELTGESLPTIGRSFGGRSHSTVLHACRRIERALPRDSAAREAVDKLRASLAR